MLRNRWSGIHPGRARWWHVVSLGAVLLGGLPVVSAARAFAQLTIEEALAGGIVLRGRVADVFGDRLLFEDATGRVLVELAGATDRPAAIEAGQTLVIEGRLRGRVLDARRVTATEGEAIAHGEPPVGSGRPADQAATSALMLALTRPADIAVMRATLEAVGFRTAGNPVRHEKSTEIPVRDARGKAWVASLDRFGRIEEIEIADYDDDSVPDRPAFALADVAQRVAREGFRPQAAAERRPQHFEILVLNVRSELVELHVDFAGQIYKQVWLR